MAMTGDNASSARFIVNIWILSVSCVQSPQWLCSRARCHACGPLLVLLRTRREFSDTYELNAGERAGGQGIEVACDLALMEEDVDGLVLGDDYVGFAIAVDIADGDGGDGHGKEGRGRVAG